MHTEDWKYQNHTLFPNVFPHEEANLDLLHKGKLWKQSWPGIPLMARWTSNFDCDQKTNWWFWICDKPFQIQNLKAKRRYEITKANRFFEVREIDPTDYVDELYKVVSDASLGYPPKYREIPSKERFSQSMESISQRADIQKIYAVF